MTEPMRGPSLGLRIFSAATGLLALRQAWLIRRAIRLQRRTEPFQARPEPRRARLLLVGDSTGAGAGVACAEGSLAGLLAAEYAQLEVVNRCRSGARIRDTLEQVPALGAQGDASRLLQVLGFSADRVVWLGCADIGVAPAVLPPVSWWLSWRTRGVMRLLAQVARRHRAEFIDFCDDAHTSRFAAEPGVYFAHDGVHPSSAAYRCCFVALQRRLRVLGVRTDAWRDAISAP